MSWPGKLGMPGEMRRLVRFGLVGATAALVYALGLLAMVHFFAAGAMLASALAYAAAIPVSFLGQKHFTFQSDGSTRRELPAYLMVQGINLIAAVLITHVVVDVLGMSHVLGIFAVIVIALLSYVGMALAVFR